MDTQKQSRRLLSLDALRGFDMFFIMGGASLFVALAALCPTPFFQAIAGQMHHVEWSGLAWMFGAYSLWMFALFFYVVDVLNFRKWTLFLR